MQLAPNTITTEADLLVSLLKDVKEISFSDAAKQLGVPVETVEAWASFLEEERILSVKYKFTTPYLSYMEEGEEKQNKSPLKLFSEQKKEQHSDIGAEIEQASQKAAAHLKAGEFKLVNDTIAVLTTKLNIMLDALSKSLGLNKAEFEARFGEIGKKSRQASGLVVEGKFDIAKSIYEDTLKSINNMLELARDESKKHESALAFTKEQTLDANSLLDKAYKLIEEGKLEDAKRIYNHLRSSYHNLPHDFREKKVELEQDLVKLNRDLGLNLDRIAQKKMNDGTSMIKSQISIANNALKKQDFLKANEAYEIIKGEFEKLPDGFLQEKRDLRNQILMLYEMLATNRRKILYAEMASKTLQIGGLLDGIRQNIAANNINAAIALYNQVQEIYVSLPMGFLKEKIDLQKKILKVYYKLSHDYKNFSMRLMDIETADINKMLSAMRESMSKNNFSEAEKIYHSIKERYDKLPKGFLQEKTELQNRILKAYADLISGSEEFTAKDINASIVEMNKLIAEAERYLKNKQYEFVRKLYSDIIDLYNSIPSGFLKSKADLRARILGIYREMTINQDEPYLKHADKTSDRAYHSILKLLLDVHQAVGRGQFDELEQGFNRINAILPEMKLDSEEKTNLMKEIVKLQEELSLYRRINSVDVIIAQKNFMRLRMELNEILKMLQRLKIASPEDKPLFDYVERKFSSYARMLKNSAVPRSASFSPVKSSVPGQNANMTIYQKISALKAVSAAGLKNPIGGA